MAAVMWAMLASPNAPASLPSRMTLLIQIAGCGFAVVALIAAERMRPGMIFTLIAVINTVLLLVSDR